MANGVVVDGNFVTFKNLHERVNEAKQYGLAGKYAFTLDTVDSLLKYIDCQNEGIETLSLKMELALKT